MSRDLKNQISVITGGADGIGFQIGEHFLKNGTKTVILVDVDEKLGFQAENHLKTVYGEESAEFIKGDVTKDLNDIFKKVTNKYGTINVLVNNAGIGGRDNPRKIIEINLLAVMEWSWKFHDHMRVDNGGRGGTIINVSSVLGFRCNSIPVNYCATKHGVLGFTKCLGHKNNFDAYGVRVIAICPGFTETKLTAHITGEPIIQSAEDVGEAAVEIYERADSGSAWIIEGAKPIEEVKPSDQ